MLLRGVVRRGNEYVAVIEDMRNGSVLNLKSGDAVLDGRLEEVNLSGVAYVRNDTRLELGIGDNLEKSGSSTSSTTTSAGASSSGKATTSQRQSDVLERLRQRRLKELGQ